MTKHKPDCGCADCSVVVEPTPGPCVGLCDSSKNCDSSPDVCGKYLRLKNAASGQGSSAQATINEFMAEVVMTLRDIRHINLLAIGNAADGGHIQVRTRPHRHRNARAEVLSWVERSQRKVVRKSWVEIEVEGHDHDGDFRSMKIEFHDNEAAPALAGIAEFAQTCPETGPLLVLKALEVGK